MFLLLRQQKRPPFWEASVVLRFCYAVWSLSSQSDVRPRNEDEANKDDDERAHVQISESDRWYAGQ
jgi:hypothetical protein